MHEIDKQKEKEPLGALGDIIYVRHGDYHNPYAGKYDGYDPEQAGLLNEAGKTQATEFATEFLDRISEQDVDVIVFSSTSAVILDDGTKLGKRAEHTANIILEQMRQRLADDPNSGVRILNDESSLSEPLLEEPHTHYIEGSSNPSEYMDALISHYGSKFRREGYHEGQSDEDIEETSVDLDAIGGKIGAESIEEFADRLLAANREYMGLVNEHYIKDPNRKLVILALTHDNILREVEQRVMGMNTPDYQFKGNLASVDLKVDQPNEVRLTVGGNEKVLAVMPEEISS